METVNFGIQDLLGLADKQLPATVDHHITMAASRMAYLNAHAAVAAAFLPHGIHGQQQHNHHNHHNLLQSCSGSGKSYYNYLVTLARLDCLWNFFSFRWNKDIFSYFMEWNSFVVITNPFCSVRFVQLCGYADDAKATANCWKVAPD